MSFWLATLNPGKKRRKKKGRRRLKRDASGHFVSRKHKVRRKKKKAVVARKRRKFLRRHHAKVARRSKMARTSRKGRRRRSTVAKRRSSRRRVSARRRKRVSLKGWIRMNKPRRNARRYKRNSVVPVSWNPGTKRRAKRRNPTYWIPRHKVSVGRAKTTGRFRPYRRNYRRNGVLPFSWNPLGGNGPIGAITSRLGEFIDIGFWTETALPATAGFLGSKVVGGIIMGLADKAGVSDMAGAKGRPFVQAAANAVGGAALAWGAGKFIGKKYEEAIWLGTVVSVAHSILKAVLGGTEIAKAIGLDGLGEDVSSAMRDAVARRVQSELSGYDGMGAFLTQRGLEPQLNGMGAFVTDRALRAQAGYSALPSGSLSDYDVATSETSL